jgi:TP901 family phage tail tape measure protein
VAFNIVAQLNLEKPQNVDKIINDISSRLKNIKADINVNIKSTSLNSIKSATDKLGALSKALIEVKANATSANEALSGFARSVSSIGSAFNTVGRSTSKLKEVKQATDEARDAAEDFGRAAGLAGRRFAGFSLVAGTFLTVIGGIKKGLSDAIEFEREFIKISQIGSITTTDLKKLNNEIGRLATTFGVSSKEILQTSITLRQAGLSVKDVTVALEALSKTNLGASFTNLKETTEGAVAILAQFGLQTKDLESSLGSVNAVSNAFAVEAGDIIKAVQRAGGSFKSLGGDLNEFQALFTSVRQTTRESAETIATGLRTIFARLQRKDTVDSIKQIGINLRFTREEAEALGNVNLTDQFVGGFESIRRLSEGIKNIPSTDPRFSAITEQLGGFRQIAKVLPLLQQFSVAQEALNVAQAGSVTITTAAEQAQGTLLVKLTKVQEGFSELFRTIAGSDGFQTFANTVIRLGNFLVGLADQISPLIPVLTLLGTLKIASGVTSFFTGVGAGFTGNGPKRLASGGPVPGRGNGDTVPAMLTPGEFVIRKDSAQSIGYDNLSKLNRNGGGNVKKMANGGQLSQSDLDSAIKELNKRFGIDIGKASTGINLLGKDQNNVLGGAKGAFDFKSGQILINPNVDKEKLLSTLFHESVHGFDRLGSLQQGLGTTFSSQTLGTGLGQFAGQGSKFFELVGKTFPGLASQTGENIKKQGFSNLLQYLLSPPEVAANTSELANFSQQNVSGIKKELAQLIEGKPIQGKLKGLFEQTGLPAIQQISKGKSLADLLPKRFAGGGKIPQTVINDPVLKQIFNDLIKKTGVNFNSGVGQVGGLLGKKSDFGDFDPNTKKIRINRELNGKQTESALFHELIHSQDDLAGKLIGVDDFASETSSNKSQRLVPEFKQLAASLSPEVLSGFPKAKGELKDYLSLPSESLAFGVQGLKTPFFEDLTKQFMEIGPNGELTLKPSAAKLDKQISGRLFARMQEISLGAAVSPTTRIVDQAQPGVKRKFAQGGRSTDTVPAMLTPGEFVLNKNAAASIGGANLNVMNKHGRLPGYAKGGFVGMANGGQAAGGNFVDQLNAAQQANVDFSKRANEAKRREIEALNKEVAAILENEKFIQEKINEDKKKKSFFGRLRGIDSQSGTLGALAFGTAASLITPLLTAGAKTIEESIQKGDDESLQKSVRAERVGGALTGATTGAALGSFIPVIGPIIGGLLGAAVGGLFSGSDSRIRDARIDKSTNKFSEDIGKLANGGLEKNAINIAANAKELDNALSLITEKAKDQATGFFSGFSLEEFNEERKKELRNQFSNQLPQIQGFLIKSSEELGKQFTKINQDLKGEDLSKGLKALDKTFEEANNGYNKQLLRLVSEIRGLSVKDLQDELRKVRISSANAERVQQTLGEGRVFFSRSLGELQGFASAVEASTTTLQQFSNSLEAGVNLLSGSSSPINVLSSERAIKEIGGPNTNNFQAALAGIASPFGDSGSGDLTRFASAFDDISRGLNDSNRLIVETLDNDLESLSQKLENSLFKSLGLSGADGKPNRTGATTEQNKIINDAIAQFNFIGTDKARELAREGKLAEELLKGASGIKDVLVRIATDLTANTNEFIRRYSQALTRVNKITEEEVKLSSINLQAVRNRQQQAFQQDAVVRNPTIEQLGAADTERFLPLRRLGVQNTTDANEISRELRKTLDRIPGAEQAQQFEFKTTGGGSTAAAKALADLQDRASQLNNALKDLADVAQRNVAAQEVLTNIQKERSGRTSFGEKLLTADPKQRLEINRGLALANIADKQGNFQGFRNDQIRQVLDALRSFGDASIFINGQRKNASELSNQLIRKSGFDVPKDDRDREKKAFDEIAKNLQTARKAQEGVINAQKAENTRFLERLEALQRDFFINLQVNTKTEELRRKELEALDPANRSRELQRQQAGKNLLGSIGINTDEQLSNLQKNRKPIEQLVQANKELNDFSKARSGFRQSNTDFVGGLNFEEGIAGTRGFDITELQKIIEERLTGAGISPKDINVPEVVKNFQDRFSASNLGTTSLIPKDFSNNQLNDFLKNQIGNQLALGEGRRVGALGAATDDVTKQTSGINVRELLKIVSDEKGLKNFNQALIDFNDKNSLKGLDDRIKANQISVEAFNKQIEELTTSIAKLNAGLANNGPNQLLIPGIGSATTGFASGGIAGINRGRPRGTDTIPAMLTPGEFVVNAKSAAQHSSLLTSINSGVAYMQNGGRIRKPIFTGTEIAAANTGVGLDKLANSMRAKYNALGQTEAEKQLYQSDFARFLGRRNRGLTNQSSINTIPGSETNDFKRSFLEGRRNRIKAAQLRNLKKNGIRKFAEGGFVSGLGNDDTVRALLTPGEFVMNRGAVNAAGLNNLSGFNAKFADGGLVQNNGAGVDTNNMFGGFSESVQQMQSAINIFSTNVDSLAKALANFPATITGQFRHDVNFTINGAEILTSLMPEVSKLVEAKAKQVLSQYVSKNMPEAGQVE